MNLSFKKWYEDSLLEVVKDFSKLPSIDVDILNKDFVFNDEEVAKKCFKTLRLSQTQVSEEDVDQCVKDKKASFDKIPNGGYTSRFFVNQEKYILYFRRQYGMLFKDHDLEGIFAIEFKGPDSYRLTRRHSPSDANKVYTNVIAGVVKSINIEKKSNRPVNGFYFDAFEPEMSIVYDYFYRIFLKPRGYLKVDSDLYLEKNYLKQLMSKITNDNKKEILKSVLDNRNKQNLEKIRQEKALQKKLDFYVNKIIVAKKKNISFLCFVRNYDKDYDNVPYLNVIRLAADDLFSEKVYLQEILNQNIDSEQALNFINVLRNNTYFTLPHHVLDSLRRQYFTL